MGQKKLLIEEISKILKIIGVNENHNKNVPVIDVIILSLCKNDEIKQMNINCINSLNESTDNYIFNIILIETDSDNVHEYPQNNVTVIQPNEKFNYNKFLNIGLDNSKNDWVLITNNDTVYYNNFIDSMMSAHNNDPDLLSMSPMDVYSEHQVSMGLDKDVHYGYDIMRQLVGWSILFNRKILDIIGKFDEDFTFFYQDNDYSKKLEMNNIKHGCVTNARARHLVSVSHELIEPNEYREMTDGMEKIFKSKWG